MKVSRPIYPPRKFRSCVADFMARSAGMPVNEIFRVYPERAGELPKGIGHSPSPAAFQAVDALARYPRESAKAFLGQSSGPPEVCEIRQVCALLSAGCPFFAISSLLHFGAPRSAPLISEPCVLGIRLPYRVPTPSGPVGSIKSVLRCSSLTRPGIGFKPTKSGG